MKSLKEYLQSGRLSYSQNNQDLLVTYYYGDSPGFFVEFGAMDGIELSNTLLLEKYYGWSGIVAEPLPIFSDKISENRSCSIEYKCVSNKSGEVVEFYETSFPALSTIADYAYSDHWGKTREDHIVHKIETISLKDMLKKHNAPKIVDYLSIDTEGSEFDILSAFDFSTRFNIITCEHNNSSMRDPIYQLLTSQGYKRVYPEISAWEDWYVHEDFR
jgi:FkbM family methyltransferase